MPICMTLNCALTISNYISSMFEVHGASRNDLYFQVTVDIYDTCQTWNQYSHPRTY